MARPSLARSETAPERVACAGAGFQMPGPVSGPSPTEEQTTADKRGVPLESIAGFPESARNRLAELWITTAEDLVGAAVREEGARGLAEFLGVPESELDVLVGQAMSALPPGIAFAPGDIRRYGLGALDEPGEEGPEEMSFFAAALPAHIDLHDGFSPVRNQGGHAMCMVGYQDDPDVPGGGYFLVRNSWGTTTWGRDNAIAPGYARIPYAYIAEHGRSAHVAYTLPRLSWWRQLWKRWFG